LGLQLRECFYIWLKRFSGLACFAWLLFVKTVPWFVELGGGFFCGKICGNFKHIGEENGII
jgi:hypothetical protein